MCMLSPSFFCALRHFWFLILQLSMSITCMLTPPSLIIPITIFILLTFYYGTNLISFSCLIFDSGDHVRCLFCTIAISCLMVIHNVESWGGWGTSFSCAAIFDTAWVVQALSCACLGYCMGGIGESK